MVCVCVCAHLIMQPSCHQFSWIDTGDLEAIYLYQNEEEIFQTFVLYLLLSTTVNQKVAAFVIQDVCQTSSGLDVFLLPVHIPSGGR